MPYLVKLEPKGFGSGFKPLLYNGGHCAEGIGLGKGCVPFPDTDMERTPDNGDGRGDGNGNGRGNGGKIVNKN